MKSTIPSQSHRENLRTGTFATIRGDRTVRCFARLVDREGAIHYRGTLIDGSEPGQPVNFGPDDILDIERRD